MGVAVKGNDGGFRLTRHGGELLNNLDVAAMDTIKFSDRYSPPAAISRQGIKPVIHGDRAHEDTFGRTSHHNPTRGRTRGMNA